MNTKRRILLLTLHAMVVAILSIGPGCQSTPEAESAAPKAFNESVSGKALLDESMARARAENKRVLLLFGANWCPYCRALSGLTESDPAIRAVLEKSYVVARIDVGKSGSNRNTALVDRYGAPVFTEGLPALVITDAQGKRLAPSRDNPWSVKTSLGAENVLAFLEKGRQ